MFNDDDDFDDDDDDEDDNDLFESDLDRWISNFEHELPKEFVSHPDAHQIELDIFYQNYNSLITPLTKAIERLLPRHYPLFEDELRPKVIERINKIAKDTASTTLIGLFRLVYDQRSGVKIREKYTDFETLKEWYARSPQPQFIGNEYRSAAPKLTDQEWAERVIEVNESIQEEFDEENEPRVEFIDALQSVLLPNYREIENLNSDELFAYAIILSQGYSDYCNDAWLIDCFIEFKLPISDLDLPEYDLEKKIVAIKAKRLEEKNSRLAEETQANCEE
ncbi:hypothetical protein [Williamwhitmania taraxaci]|uniref:Uncharacterized protein n=1 Tax=Williamwhitmania taraxaci TaxID=1640674 RepID=A0A1G6L1Y1_9BACT|nr:hypothetical protein [Williamwhitmania taraxaci]SDC37332.1 hypothetical protein SAMN05216323_102833 [Williamwhitmania taraxaci]